MNRGDIKTIGLGAVIFLSIFLISYFAGLLILGKVIDESVEFEPIPQEFVESQNKALQMIESDLKKEEVGFFKEFVLYDGFNKEDILRALDGGKSLFVEVPYTASDEEVRKIADEVRLNFDPRLRVYVSGDGKVITKGTEAYDFALKAGETLGFEEEEEKVYGYYATRQAQIYKIFSEELGIKGYTVYNVLKFEVGNSWWLDFVLTKIEDPTVNPGGKFVNLVFLKSYLGNEGIRSACEASLISSLGEQEIISFSRDYFEGPFKEGILADKVIIDLHGKTAVLYSEDLVDFESSFEGCSSSEDYRGVVALAYSSQETYRLYKDYFDYLSSEELVKFYALFEDHTLGSFKDQLSLAVLDQGKDRGDFVEGKGDRDLDEVLDFVDCDPDSSLVGQCSGCSVCDPSEKRCVEDDNLCEEVTCPIGVCGGFGCAEDEVAIFESSVKQSCSVEGDIGICGNSECSLVECRKVEIGSCSVDSDSDGVIDAIDKCRGSFGEVNRRNGCPYPFLDSFDSDLTTDLSNVLDLGSIEGLEIGKDGTKVTFEESVSLLDGQGGAVDLGGVIEIGEGRVKVESGNVPFLDVVSRIKFSNVDSSLQNPAIYKDGILCDSGLGCQRLGAAFGEVEFRVPGFSEYTLGQTETDSYLGSSEGFVDAILVDVDKANEHVFDVEKSGRIYVRYEGNVYLLDLGFIGTRYYVHVSPNENSYQLNFGEETKINLDLETSMDIALEMRDVQGDKLMMRLERLSKVVLEEIPSQTSEGVVLQQGGRDAFWRLMLLSVSIGVAALALIGFVIYRNKKKEYDTGVIPDEENRRLVEDYLKEIKK